MEKKKHQILCTTCGEAPGFEKQMGGAAFGPGSGDGSVYWRLVCDCSHKQNVEFVRSRYFAAGTWESETYKI